MSSTVAAVIGVLPGATGGSRGESILMPVTKQASPVATRWVWIHAGRKPGSPAWVVCPHPSLTALRQPGQHRADCVASFPR